jgi:RNA polymerase sigma-70 factor (ECF subfamily)
MPTLASPDPRRPGAPLAPEPAAVRAQEPAAAVAPEGAAVLDAAALYRAHAGFVATFAGRLGVPAGDIDDVVQETFLVALRRGGYREGPARPTTWLAEIVLRVCSTLRRTRRRKSADGGDDELALVPAPDDPFEKAAATEALSRVERALSTLDLDHRAALVLFELHGESCETIAAGLGVPIGTVYSRIHHARRKFQSAYEALTADAKPAPLASQGAAP